MSLDAPDRSYREAADGRSAADLLQELRTAPRIRPAGMSAVGAGPIGGTGEEGSEMVEGKRNETDGDAPPAPRARVGKRRQFLAGLGGAAGAAALAVPSAPARAAAAHHGPFTSVQEYGARGDGTADDTGSVLKAIAAARKGDRSVYFPPGRYLVSETVPLASPVTLLGAGELVSSIVTNQAAGDLLVAKSEGVDIRHLGFASSVPRTAGAYVNFTAASYQSSLAHFWMTGAFVGVNMASGAMLYVENGAIRSGASGAGTAAITVTGGNAHYLRAITTDNDAAAQPSAGIWIQDTGCINITDCDIIHCANDLYVTGGFSIYAINSLFDTAHCGILVEPKTPVTRCHFIGCWTSSHQQSGVIIRSPAPGLPGAVVGDIDFIGHHCFLNGGDGFTIEEGTNIQIANSTIAQNAGTGIVLGPGASGCRVTGNMIGATSILKGNGAGVSVHPSSRGNFITGNRITGNTTAQLSVDSANNSVHLNMGVDV